MWCHCKVLAYNAHGYLLTSQDPTDHGSQHAGSRDSLLLERKYYYFIPSKPQYDIYWLFSEWPFPHKLYVEVWGSGILDSGVKVEHQTDGTSLAIREQDSIYAILGCSNSLSMLHIVLIAESDWVCVLIIISLWFELCCISCTSMKWTCTWGAINPCIWIQEILWLWGTIYTWHSLTMVLKVVAARNK